MNLEPAFDDVLEALEESEKAYDYFCKRVISLLENNPQLDIEGLNCVHSVRSRRKSRSSIKGKCRRKLGKEVTVTPDNCHSEIEDFFGIRLLHLHLDQLPLIHEFLKHLCAKGEFIFGETPKAYTWDPEFKAILEKLGFQVEFKESMYTSVHYILRNSADSPIRCELQVRTLFEEAWGELDHWMNYPHPTENMALREQLLVLSRVVTAASRLAVSIHRLQIQAQEDG
ncbi:(p)ppGpp synthetase [Agrobacterium vitis]|uniref:(p)ppGpp synthetase n=1 Tax=Agrobacterium vitis TaxID=373 RepID=UPI001F1E7F1C|nr:(p)ppGpp synthetase [Agrobacterium vitis]MCF1468250.1 (p)ppGpp synthetase [Agrobacterium vitis]